MPKSIKIVRNGHTHYLSGVKCPACKMRWETTTSNPNLLNHIKAKARNELLAVHLMGAQAGISMAHADWLQRSVRIEPEFVRRATIKLGKATFSFNLLK